MPSHRLRATENYRTFLSGLRAKARAEYSKSKKLWDRESEQTQKQRSELSKMREQASKLEMFISKKKEQLSKWYEEIALKADILASSDSVVNVLLDDMNDAYDRARKANVAVETIEKQLEVRRPKEQTFVPVHK